MELEVGHGEVIKCAQLVSRLAQVEELLLTASEADKKAKLRIEKQNLKKARERFFRNTFGPFPTN